MSDPTTTLMHPIEANNLKDSGYFPTDYETIYSVMSRLANNENRVNILDPCCGEGMALSLFHKIWPNAVTYGIELDYLRSEKSKRRLDHVFYADINDVSLGRGHFDCLFLNPPYGRTMTDKMSEEKSQRLEHKFLVDTFPALKAGGVLIYIVPAKSIDEARIKWLVSRFEGLTIHKAAVDTYKQVVVIGKKLKHQRSVAKPLVERLLNQRDELLPFSDDCEQMINITESNFDAKVVITKLDEWGVAEVKKHYPGQWASFKEIFESNTAGKFERPIHALSEWHLALLITSGAVQGFIDNGMQKLLIRGGVKKYKHLSETSNQNELTGDVTTTYVAKDRFQAQIKAIDVTSPNSKTFGDIITIR